MEGVLRDKTFLPEDAMSQKSYKLFRVCGLIGACALPCISFATTISASSSAPAIGPANATIGSATFKTANIDTMNNPTITWHSGPNTADSKLFPGTPEGTESKFTLQFNSTTQKYDPIGKQFVGFTDSDAVFSTADTSGSGGSFVRGNTAIASWILTATGTLGAPPAPTLPNYSSVAEAHDPWPILSSDLTLGGDYSVFFSMSLDGASLSPNGSIRLDASYQTAAGTMDLLKIGIGRLGVSVSSDSPLGLSIYELSGVGADPNTLSETPLTLGQIEALVSGDLLNGVVQSPLAFGFLLNGINFASEVAPGVAGYEHVDSQANDSAVGTLTPEPATCRLAGAALIGLGLLRKLRAGR
jgi:hypothetical protein